MSFSTVRTGYRQQLCICAGVCTWCFGASRRVNPRDDIAGRAALSRHMLVRQDRFAGQGQSNRHVKHLTTLRHAERKPLDQQTSRLQPTGPSAIEGRQTLLATLPVESFKMVGVSFQGRQELVSVLQPGKPKCL